MRGTRLLRGRIGTLTETGGIARASLDPRLMALTPPACRFEAQIPHFMPDGPLGLSRSASIAVPFESRVVFRIQGSEEIVPNEGIKSEIETWMLVMLGMKGRCSQKVKSWDRPESSRERFNSRMPQRAP